MKRRIFTGFALAALLTAASCGGDDGATTAEAAPSGADAELSAEVVQTYADGVHSAYSTSLASATAMSDKVDAFLAEPTEATLGAARQAWLDARPDYGVTEAFRFYGGPIDADETGPEGQINAWPMDESYVDYVEDDPTSGIINDPKGHPELTPAAIAELNEAGGETNVSTGWHAIEFLLWGQDLSDDGPGERPAKRRPPQMRTVAASILGRSPACCWTTCRAWLTTGIPHKATTTAASSWRFRWTRR